MNPSVRLYLGPWAVAGCIALMGFQGAQARVYISKDPTRNIACSGGVCTATAPHAVLNVKRLTRMLAMQDVTVRGTSSAMDIFVEASVSWSSARRLTLDSYRSILFDSHLVVAGTGGVTLITNDGGTDGDFRFNRSKSYIRFWDPTSSLVVNGVSYKLEDDLKTLASDMSADPAGNYALANHYNALKDGTYAQPPVAIQFFGEFEGLGNAIKNLTVNGTVRIVDKGDRLTGLFARNSGVLRDVRVIDANVTGSGKYVDAGALVGENSGTIVNSSSTGQVSSSGLYSDAGGLVGWNAHEIRNSSSSASVSSESAGGLVGVNWGRIRYSYSGGSVAGIEGGGLVGYNQYGLIDQSYASGPLDCGSYLSPCGGLAGTNSKKGVITNAYASGSVTAEAGANTGTDIGGLVGYNQGKISFAYARGSLSAPSKDDIIGGLVGGDTATPGGLANTYWDLETTGITDPSQGAGNVPNDPGITGLTTAQFQSGLPAGFDPTIWAVDASINGGFPYLHATIAPVPRAPAASAPGNGRSLISRAAARD